MDLNAVVVEYGKNEKLTLDHFIDDDGRLPNDMIFNMCGDRDDWSTRMNTERAIRQHISAYLWEDGYNSADINYINLDPLFDAYEEGQ